MHSNKGIGRVVYVYPIYYEWWEAIRSRYSVARDSGMSCDSITRRREAAECLEKDRSRRYATANARALGLAPASLVGLVGALRGELSLRARFQEPGEYIAHYHHERTHQDVRTSIPGTYAKLAGTASSFVSASNAAPLTLFE